MAWSTRYNRLIILFILIIIVASTMLCYSNPDSGSAVKNKKEPPEVELDRLYLGNFYLLPDPPGDGAGNFTKLSALNQTTFSHNISDRKFNQDIKPRLRLWLDAFGTQGITLEFELTFQAVEDQTLLPNKVYRIVFKNYTTQGLPGQEYVNLTYTKYDGEPFDIKSGADNWAGVYLTIRRIDNKKDADLRILTGAGGKISYVKIPYDQTLSSYQYEEEDNSSTPGFAGGYLVLSITTIIFVTSFKKH
jgi:hypothetical protein